jgi:hypothetical protein
VSGKSLVSASFYGQNSTNFAVLSELGRFPLHFNVIKAMIRYYDRLKKIEEMFLHAYLYEAQDLMKGDLLTV